MKKSWVKMDQYSGSVITASGGVIFLMSMYPGYLHSVVIFFIALMV